MAQQVVYTNWIDDLDILAQREQPKDVEELCALVRWAVSQGRRIRAVGSGHSMSSAPRPRDIFVDLEKISGAFPEVGWTKRNPPGVEPGEHLIRVRAGTQIKQLNRVILPSRKPRPLGLPNMGSFDGQTLAGAIGTSTHGTGVRFGSLADLVASVEMVAVENDGNTPRVGVYRIEPRDGITDPQAFRAAAGEHGMTLIQDDDIFHSVVVSYGCMGIAVAYTIKVEEEYWLKETSVLVDWPDLRTKLRKAANLGRELGVVPHMASVDRHFSFLFNTAETQGKNATEKAACIIYHRNPVEEPEKPKGWIIPRWPPERRKHPVRNFISNVLPKKAHKEHDKLGKNMRRLFFQPESKQRPFVGGREESVSYIVHRRMAECVFSGREEDPKPPPDAISLELAVRAMDVGDAVDFVIRQIKKSQFFFVVPLGVRFVAPSKHFLAPTFDRASAYVEVPMNLTRGKAGGERMSREETRELVAKPALQAIEMALRAHPSLEARPHLGKYHTMDRAQLEKQYPRFKKWLAAYRRFNPIGTFDNDFTDQLGLTGEREPSAGRRTDAERPVDIGITVPLPGKKGVVNVRGADTPPAASVTKPTGDGQPGKRPLVRAPIRHRRG